MAILIIAGVKCRPLKGVANGKFTISDCSKKPIDLGGVCSVKCNTGYTHAPGFTGYLCNSNRQWTPDPTLTLCRREYIDGQSV